MLKRGLHANRRADVTFSSSTQRITSYQLPVMMSSRSTPRVKQDPERASSARGSLYLDSASCAAVDPGRDCVVRRAMQEKQDHRAI